MITFPAFETESERVSGILEMIARRAPVLMKAGGGALQQESRGGDRRGPKFASPEQSARALRMAELGKLTATEIAAKTGVSVSSVRCMCRRRGIRLPDGRARA